MKSLYPVILSVPEEKKGLSPRERVIFLSSHARAALDLSAEFSQVSLGELRKNPDGVPLASSGYYWSITHKPFFVGGVVSVDSIGMDIEQIKPFHPGLFKKVAVEAEWALSDQDRHILFYRFWTAKEAVIKALGTGLRDLLKCRVVAISNKNTLAINIGGREFYVEHCYFNDHIASVIKNDARICWRIDPVILGVSSGFSQ